MPACRQAGNHKGQKAYNCNFNFILFNKITIPITATAKNADHNMPGHPDLKKCGTITIPINAVK